MRHHLPYLLLAFAAAPLPAAAQTLNYAAVVCEDVKKPFFLVSCDKAGGCMARPNRRTSLARSFSLPKPAGVKRIFIVGESAASILGVRDEMTGGSRGLEVINCGMGAYESSRIETVFHEILEYEPDLIVMLSGNNEGGSYPCPGLYFEAQRRFRKLTELAYSWRGGQKTAAIKASLKMQERRLDSMAKEASRRKLPLIFCTLPANLGDMPPSGAAPAENIDFVSGMTALEKGDFAQATGKFDAILKKDPFDLFALFYLGKALHGAGRPKEAKEAYKKILELDARQARASPSRNEMIRHVAARHGAGLCDLEKAFYAVSRDEITGSSQIADDVHWRPAYNALVWGELVKAGRAMGLGWLKEVPGARTPQGLTLKELRHAFSYALVYMDNSSSRLLTEVEARAGVLSEKALSLMSFIDGARPGLLEKTGSSEKSFRDFFLSNFFSQQTSEGLERLRPLFLAHLAEIKKRQGKYEKSLALINNAAAMDPCKPYFRLVKAGALLRLGREEEAGRELMILRHTPIPKLRQTAEILAAERGLRMPGDKLGPVEPETSRKLAAEGIKRFSAGDAAGAQSALAEAIRLNPFNAKAFLALCSIHFGKKDFSRALEACDFADMAAASYAPEARRMLASDALQTKGLIYLALGRREEAARELKKSLKDPPPHWTGMEAVRAELKKLGAEQALPVSGNRP
ncbi:MAG TPA: hypothetical protein DEB40_07120 [Elusimicrobia bacterium]|nr:hypothetical protein [Elusimicrobiota bacterium]HBT61499.1 hypothetical protein [Elusimicrobiota bacterium]